ncbi:MAG: oligopeptide transporter, OPT family [Zetaproteobacteria bacterium]|nr:oligopeptide transporter, OPT family [Pseudobdellovibrionaceae bacterium]
MKKNHQPVKELSVLSVTVGLFLAVIMTAANVYMGLYAGMTISASIPAAVASAAFFRGVLRQKSLYQSNIVQTMASAGESLAAGIIFTVPALVLIGSWQDFRFWPTTLIAICGGLLGVIFMIPLRKVLIVNKRNDLTYPEGVACAKVLQASSESDASSDDASKGMVSMLTGLFIGSIIKFLSGGLKWISGSVEKAWLFKSRPFFVGFDVSPALLGVGYIVGLNVSALVFLGGVIGWFIALPFFEVKPLDADVSALDHAWNIWTSQIRYIGVGAMLVGGFLSVLSVRQGIIEGFKQLKSSFYKTKQTQTHYDRLKDDMNTKHIFIIFVLCFFIMLWLYNSMLGSLSLSFFTAIIMILASFPFVAVSSYIVGLVGSSNNPVSGITIAVLISTALIFLLLGFEGQPAILATLGIASVVCCAACTAGDCSQDLKTGQIIEATPRMQQWAQCIGILIPAITIAPTLSLLHNAYGIGQGLKAPQATLFASITEGFFGKKDLPYSMVLVGVGIAFLILFFDKILVQKGSKFRLHLMPIAVGVYLPISLAVPLFIGGLVRYLVEKNQDKKQSSDTGTLFSSGLIAGEAVSGIVIAILISLNISLSYQIQFPASTIQVISSVLFLVLTWILYKFSLNKGDSRKNG